MEKNKGARTSHREGVGTSLAALQFVFSCLSRTLLRGAGHDYGVLSPQEQLEPSGVSVGCFVSQGMRVGSPAPDVGHLGMLPFLRPGAFKGNVETFPPQGLAVLQIPGQTARYKPVCAGGQEHSVLGGRVASLGIGGCVRNRAAWGRACPGQEAAPAAGSQRGAGSWT